MNNNIPYLVKRLMVEVDHAPSYVEVFLTFIDKHFVEYRDQEWTCLVSIPTWKFSFFVPVSVNEYTLAMDLEEAPNAAPQWINPLARGISKGVSELLNEVRSLNRK